ncbi:division plane positioning ATPase MipZ [Allohahella marinimesophila]|uniref:CobQ/CobB/MinD/ParA nucleotide binding domain-containing protein n=1 Tax=Allohahella marinimesophila TaxID=1054972 RepID=A0ABP7PFF6_9GAMM
MSRVHFIGGEKGGVGKSMTARVLAQYLIDAGRPFVGFDADASHSTFARFYDEFSSQITIDEYESLDQILQAAEDHPDSDIIVDLAAQTSRSLERWIDDSDAFAAFEELGKEVFFWHVMDDGADSIRLLETLLDQQVFGSVQLVVVQNEGRGGNFGKFEASEAFRKAQGRYARFVTLPRLSAPQAQKIDFNNMSFWAAANNRDMFSIGERQRVRAWLKKVYKSLQDTLGSSSTETSSQVAISTPS